MSTSSVKWWVAVLGLVVALAPAPSSLSLALHVDVGHAGHVGHQHPVDLEQWSQRSPGDVRCYCNLPACITTGYMCKSAGRGCFSDLVDHVDVYRARHGCLDLLDSGRQQQCKNQPRPPSDQDADDVPAWEQDAAQPDAAPAAPQGAVEAVPQDAAVAEVPLQDAVRPRATQDTPSLLLCCTDDMCNHIDSPDSRMRHGPNGSDVTMSSPAGVVLPPGAAAGVASIASSETAAAAAAAARSAELWFKAATIAVPICGALILVLLMVLAVRLLRADSQHHRASKLSACAFPALSDKKVPLLPCGTGWGHGVNRLDCSLPPGLPPKNHALAKLNYTATYDLLDLHRDAHLAANNQRNKAPRVHAKASYRQVLASFAPWASAAAEPPTNV